MTRGPSPIAPLLHYSCFICLTKLESSCLPWPFLCLGKVSPDTAGENCMVIQTGLPRIQLSNLMRNIVLPAILPHSPDLLALSFWVTRAAILGIPLSKPPSLPSLLFTVGGFIFHLSGGWNRSYEMWVVSGFQASLSARIFPHLASFLDLTSLWNMFLPSSKAHVLAHSVGPVSPDFSFTSLSVIVSCSYLYIQPLLSNGSFLLRFQKKPHSPSI